MDSVGLAIAFAAFVWWFSTGAILLLLRLPPRARPWAMAAFGVVTLLSVWGLAATRSNTSVAGALAGFTYGIVIWGFLETSFLFGYVTGPRRAEQSAGARGLLRFREAFDTLSYHELAILAVGIGLMALTSGAANEVGTWTFLCLWANRISAKLNLFYGAPNVSLEFLPPHLAYLGSYFRRDRVSLFFPFSVMLASLCFGALVRAAATATVPYDVTALTLIATMFGLAIMEHWFLVLPLPDSALWRWALKAGPAEPALDTLPPTNVIPLSTAASAASLTPALASPGKSPLDQTLRRVAQDRRHP